MKITLNNRPEEIDASEMTVNDIIQHKNFTFKLLVTKVNGKLVKTAERSHVIVRNGDTVEVMHLISGG